MNRRFAGTVALAGAVATVLLSAQEPPVAAAKAQYEQAVSLFTEGRYADALQLFETSAASADPGLRLLASMGKVRSALRIAEFDIAHRDARALATERPNDPDILALLGDAQWGMGLFDEADAAYVRAAAGDGDSVRARFGLARSLATRSRLDEALRATLSAFQAGPRDSDLHALAATVYERLGRFDAAAREYDTYAGLLPAGEAAAAATSRARAEFLRSFEERVPLEISGRGARGVHVVPFKLVRNKVVVQGRLNGQAVEWVLDTGAERSGISFDLAYRARVRAVTSTFTAGVGRAALRRIQLGRADRLEIGTLQLRHVPVSIRDPAADGAPRWQGESLSPLALGLSIVVDYGRRRVTFARQLPDERSDVTLPLRVHRLPLVRGTLNDSYPTYFVVDTGGEVISISAATAEALGMRPPRRIPLRVFGLSGLDDTAFLLPGVDLAFEEIAYRNFGLAVLNLRAPSVLLGFQVGGIVGHRFLGEYRVALDFDRAELRLSK
jgi:tetratricopeptide (TPR) repeat protein